MNFIAHKQAVAAVEELNARVAAAGLNLGDLSNGWRITQAGAVLAQLRPLHPIELLQLAAAIHVPDEHPDQGDGA